MTEVITTEETVVVDEVEKTEVVVFDLEEEPEVIVTDLEEPEVITVVKETTIVDEVEKTEVIVSDLEEAPEVVETAGGVGPPGPIGPQGPAGSAEFVIRAAGESLGGQRVVIIGDTEEVFYADPTVEDHAYRVRGLTRGAVTQGNNVEIQTQGELVEPSWSWTPGLPVFLNPNGLLSHTPPEVGFILLVGSALSPTKLFIKIELPFFLL